MVVLSFNCFFLCLVLSGNSKSIDGLIIFYHIFIAIFSKIYVQKINVFFMFSGLTKHLLQILGLHVYMPDDCRFNSTRAGLAEMHVYR